MLTVLRSLWIAASTFQKVLLVAFPLCAAYDVYAGNWFDFVVAWIVVAYIAYSIRSEVLGG